VSYVPTLSVVVPTFQRCASVRRLLTALSQQTLAAAEYEVVVSIDGSTDGTREMVSGFAAPFHLSAVWQPNGGRAAACNAGIRESRGRVVVLVDDDMEPRPEFLAAHLGQHPPGTRRGVLGAVPIHLDPDSPPAARYIRDKFKRHEAKLAQAGYSIRFRDFYSGNFSIPRDVLMEAGLFDPAFNVYGNEDSELALRLLRAGVALVYNGEAAATQHYEKDFAALARDNESKGQTAVLCLQKYPETLASLRRRSQKGSWKWRIARRLLLAMTTAAGSLPGLMVRLVDWQERRRSPQLHRYYRLTLDYFFWLGAGRAMKAWGRGTVTEADCRGRLRGRHVL
jgi:glycosyltransferase involved in cell wall biosynthesis